MKSIESILNYFKAHPVVIALGVILAILVYVNTFLETGKSILSFLPSKKIYPYMTEDGDLVFKSGIVKFSHRVQHTDYFYSLKIGTGDWAMGVISEHIFIGSYFPGGEFVSQTLLAKLDDGTYAWMAGLNEDYPDGFEIIADPEEDSIVSFHDLLKVRYMNENHWVLFDITRFYGEKKDVDIHSAIQYFQDINNTKNTQ
jgi:hypothetical protein